MHLVGLLIYYKMIHGPYNIKFILFLIKQRVMKLCVCVCVCVSLEVNIHAFLTSVLDDVNGQLYTSATPSYLDRRFLGPQS